MNDQYNRINVRLSHPTLYVLIMTCAAVGVGLGINFTFSALEVNYAYPPLGFNFVFAKPTFNPYGIDYFIIGSIFFLLGAGKMVFLNVRRLRSVFVVRLLMAVEIAWMTFWALGTTMTWFQGKTSLQLFCLYIGLMAIEGRLMFEPFANPLTGKADPQTNEKESW